MKTFENRIMLDGKKKHPLLKTAAVVAGAVLGAGAAAKIFTRAKNLDEGAIKGDEGSGLSGKWARRPKAYTGSQARRDFHQHGAASAP